MSAKTDPFLPAEEPLAITRDNSKAFSGADDFFDMTRPPKVLDDPEIFAFLQDMGRHGKVEVSLASVPISSPSSKG